MMQKITGIIQTVQLLIRSWTKLYENKSEQADSIVFISSLWVSYSLIVV